MRFIQLSLPFNRLNRLLTSFSVRTRIVVLALVPVVGFLANGLTYVSGEGEVGTAFETVKRSGGTCRYQPRFQERGHGDANHRQGFQRYAQQRSGGELRAGACARTAKP
jgi:hypothetical protein